MKHRTFTIIVPFAPDTINSMMAYGYDSSGATSLKRKWQKIAQLYIIKAIEEGKIPERFLFRIRVGFSLYFSKKRIRDEDNFYIMTKGIVDAFSALGMIEDDANDFVSFGGINLRVEPERPRVVIEIEELSPFAVAPDGLTVQNYVHSKPA